MIRHLKIIPELLARYPTQSAFVLLALIFAGFAEGIGLLGLLPLLQISMGDERGLKSGFGAQMMDWLQAIGFAPTMTSMLLFIVTFITLKALLTLAAMNYVGGVVAQIIADLRMQLIGAVIGSRWGHIQTLPSGRITNSVTVECMEASSAYRAACQFIAGGIQVLVLLAGAMLVSLPATVFGLLLGIMISVLLAGFLRISRSSSIAILQIVANINARLTDGLRGIKSLKAMGNETWMLPLLTSETSRLVVAMRRQVVAKYGLSVLREPLIVLAMAGGVFLAVGRGGMPLTELLALAALLYRAAGAAGTMQQTYQLIGTSEPYYRSVRSIIDLGHGARETTGGRAAPALEREIRLSHVSVVLGERDVLKNVSLDIPFARLTALVGPSGGGKTTLVDTICRVLDPVDGQVLVDGCSIADVDLRQWRQQIGYVPQDLFLFHDTLRKNVTLGDPALSDADLERALRLAGAADFVRQLPQGVDTVIGEQGSLLSGGQRQRIAIARALIRRPRLLILDEATTALDPATEAAIIATIKSISSEMAVLAVSHQPAIVAAADKVYEVLNGTVVNVAPAQSFRIAEGRSL